MNDANRNKLRKAVERMNDASAIVEGCLIEEQIAYEHLPDGIADSEKGRQMLEYIEYMDDAVDGMNDIVELLTGIAGE
jgi:hypothetical protein